MESLSSLTVVQRALVLMEMEQFKGVGSEEIANIASKMVELRYAAGEVISRQNEPEDRLFIVIDGEVVHQREAVVVRRVTRGMPFGLFGLLGLEDPEPEVLQAVRDTHVIALSRDDFMEAIFDDPAFAAGMIRGLGRTILAFAKRIESLEKRIAVMEKEASPPAA